MKHKLLTPISFKRMFPFSIAVLAASLSTLSGCASTKKAPVNTAKAQQQDQANDSPQLPTDSATISLYMETEVDSGTTLAYIDSFDGKQLTFDDAEWVDVPSDRAKELGVEQKAMDSGFYIYNEDTSLDTLPLAKECKCTVLDWENSYVPKEIDVKEFSAVLEERKHTKIPYEITFENEEIVKIEEHYVP